MGRITPCLWFDTQAEEAAQFYVSVFKNSRILDTSHYTEGSPRPAGEVLTVEFELDGQAFTALNGGPEFTFSEAVSFQVSCADQGEVDYYWDNLTAGGGEPGPCGWLKDRYGVSWQIVPTAMVELLGDPDPARAARAMKAMMSMGKLDIAALQAAADES
jgi:predicted 3-demethylubiquinone-9 3-methyltransferase (glyoxalase superfamily)